MTWSLSGALITQSGTDADLSGLASISGVSVAQEGAVTIYDIGDNRLRIDGALTMCAAAEEAIKGTFGTTTTAGNGILVAGSLVIGNPAANANTHARNRLAPAIRQTRAALLTERTWLNNGQGDAGGYASFYVAAGGTLQVHGHDISMRGRAAFHPSSNVVLRRASFACNIHYFYGPADLASSLLIGDLAPTILASPANWSGVEIVSVTTPGAYLRGSAAMTSSPIVIRDAQAVSGDLFSNGLDAGYGDLRFVNYGGGSDFTVGISEGRNCDVRTSREIVLSVREFQGAPLDGALVEWNGAPGREFSASSVGGAVSTEFELRHVRYAGGAILIDDRFDKAMDGTDLVDIYAYTFEHAIASFEGSKLKGVGPKEVDVVMFRDPNNSGDDLATALAKTECVTAGCVWDAMKIWKLSNTALPSRSSHPIARSGDLIDAGPYLVVVDAAAPDNFAFDGSTVVIRSNALGASLKTGAGVMLSNGATVTGDVFGTLFAWAPIVVDGQTLTRLSITSGGTVTLRNSTVAEIENVSGQHVDVVLEGSPAPSLLETNGTLAISTRLTVTSKHGGDVTVVAYDMAAISDLDPPALYGPVTAATHDIPVGAAASVLLAYKQPGRYMGAHVQPISGPEAVAVEMDRSLFVETSIDVSALVADSSVTVLAPAFGGAVQAAVRIEISNDHDLTAAQWRAYADEIAGDETAMRLVAVAGLLSRGSPYQGWEIYETTASGARALQPVIYWLPAGLNRVSTKAYVDDGSAKLLAAEFEAFPRNAQNVAILSAPAEPLIDYDLLGETWANTAAPAPVPGTLGDKLDLAVALAGAAAANTMPG